MASINQFETLLDAKNVEIDEIRMQGKNVAKVFGKISGQSYYWLGSGICFSRTGTRKPTLDLTLNGHET